MSKLSEEQKLEIREMVSRLLGADMEEVKDDSNFVQDLGADSLDEVELVMELEKMFNISIPDDQAENAKIVSAYYELVEHNL